jgi:hypothetical protein
VLLVFDSVHVGRRERWEERIAPLSADGFSRNETRLPRSPADRIRSLLDGMLALTDVRGRNLFHGPAESGGGAGPWRVGGLEWGDC